MITTSLEASLFVMTIEFGLLAVAIAYFAYRGARTVEAKTAADATELVSKVSDTEESRRLALETVFREKYQYDGDELATAVDEFMQREKAFYNAVVGAFLGRGKKKISDLNGELTKVVAPWISIMPKNMVDAETAESLAAEKSQVEVELGETKQVLEKMMAEYNRAFHIDAADETSADGTASRTIDEEMEEIEDIDDVSFGIDLATDDTADVDASTAKIEAGDPAAQDPLLSTQTIEELDYEDDALDPLLSTSTIEELDYEEDAPDPSLATSTLEELDDVQMAEDSGITSEMLEEPDDLLESSLVAQTPVEQAGKPMTADDLDELMESLETESLDDVETA